MKNPVEWHERNLKNRKLYLESRQRELKSLQLNIDVQTEEIEFLQLQIEEAKKRGKDGFDEDKFLVKRKS